MRPDRLAVIGLGAIGGSVAWQARLAGIQAVIGYSREPAEPVLALRAGALTEIADTPEKAAREASLVVLATPPEVTIELLGRLARVLAPGALVTDVASVKQPVLAAAEAAGLAERFAGSHPFTGTHESGWAAARPDRFRGAVVYVSPTKSAESDNAARQIMDFWERLMESHPVLISAEAHDRQLAWTSHLPQAVSSALMAAIAEAPGLSGASLGPGARDSTRLASSSPDLWSEIFMLNRDAMLGAIAGIQAELTRFNDLLARGDRAGLRERLARAADARRRLT